MSSSICLCWLAKNGWKQVKRVCLRKKICRHFQFIKWSIGCSVPKCWPGWPKYWSNRRLGAWNTTVCAPKSWWSKLMSQVLPGVTEAACLHLAKFSSLCLYFVVPLKHLSDFRISWILCGNKKKNKLSSQEFHLYHVKSQIFSWMLVGSQNIEEDSSFSDGIKELWKLPVSIQT